MTAKQPGDNHLSRWFAGHGEMDVYVISPHLDDAALSTFGLLSSELAARCCVVTVFTDACEDTDPAWAHQTGFRDPVHEFQVRREEDIRAMTSLGVKWRHAGYCASKWTPAQAAQLAAGIHAERTAMGRIDTDEFLVLLPAGAGRKLNRLESFMRRITRKPFGSDIHYEHAVVRNHLFEALRNDNRVHVGFYAEIPYSWNEHAEQTLARLNATTRLILHEHWLSPAVSDKIAIVTEYKSQFLPIVGKKPAYQRKMLAKEELYFLP